MALSVVTCVAVRLSNKRQNSLDGWEITAGFGVLALASTLEISAIRQLLDRGVQLDTAANPKTPASSAVRIILTSANLADGWQFQVPT